MDINSNEYEEIQERMKNEKNRRQFERYQTIHLHFQGMTVKEICRIVGRSQGTIRSYLKAYQSGGIDGLDMNFSPGAPRRLTQEQQDTLKRTIITSLPYEVGFTAKHNWTLQLAGDFIKREFGQTYTLQGVANILHRLGLSHTKPTYTLAAADEVKQKEFAEITFPTLKKDS